MSTSTAPRTLQRALLTRLLADAPFQPATNYWRAVEIAAVLPTDFPPGRGLDLGCGDGRLMRLVCERLGQRRIVGVDPDPLETRFAAQEGVYEQVHTALGNAVPEPDASFDWVFSNSVLEHIPDIPPVLAEVARVLRPRGRFVFTVPRDTFHGCLAGSWLPWVSRSAYLEMLDRRCAHVRYWSVAEWDSALQQAGLELLEARAYLSPRDTRRWETLARLTSGVLYGLGRGRRRPIEIQRALALRGRRLHRSLAAALAWMLMPRGAEGDADQGSCVVVVAQRPR